MFKKHILFLISFFLLGNLQLKAQKTFPINGVSDERNECFAFTNATIFKSYNQKLEKATLVIRDGKVESIGSTKAPKDAIIVDLEGKYIYPSFIDIFSEYGVPEPKAVGEKPKKLPQMLSNKKGAYLWNEALKPETTAHTLFNDDETSAKTYIDLGFGALSVHLADGISRGSATLVSLNKGKPHDIILKNQTANHLSFSKGKSTQNYPSSQMGVIALLRQTYYDAEWYKKEGYKEEKNLSLEAWNELQDLPQIFEIFNVLEIFRAHKISKEFNKPFIYKCNAGDHYKRLEAIKALNIPLVINLNFPDVYDVEDPYDARLVSLSDMKHWEMAPANPGLLEKEGIEFALTTKNLKERKHFLTNLKKAVKHGLSEEAALKALTYTPAKLINVSDIVGSLDKGKLANFVICSEPIFAKESKIHENWIQGKAYVVNEMDGKDLSGNYELNLPKEKYNLEVTSNKEMNIIIDDSTKWKVSPVIKDKIINLHFKKGKDGKAVRLSGTIQDKTWSGRGSNENGNWISWNAKYNNAIEKKKDDEKKNEKEELDKKGAIYYPFMAYGWEEKPTAESYLFKNATVWTNEEKGILENADVLIKDGKIAAVGEGLEAGSATVIDAKGKHLTTGIIDEHSHIGISKGVNEGTQVSSAEVSIADVINSEDINIYRQLAGGVTSAQLLHGSANPIGGQSAIIKFRWGYLPEDMKIKNADPFIKFALGENVKQSNWGDDYTIRFPQSRMGVEQVFDDYFTQAKAYAALKNSGKTFRKDLDMETILEIMQSKRFVTCHSYQQGEINMLMKVADRHNWKMNTFTHILEGYKVADKMKEHGVGASTFSDWWAYKYEVIDAIPYNGALLHEQGIVTAFNSDDAEMARRLNQEAAKAVKYGAISEEEAWKFVTLNPAKLLHLDNRMGSMKVGKDADIVLWSDNPLSIYAKAEMTFVDGIKFFDRAEDLLLRKKIREEKTRLINKMIKEKSGGAKTQAAGPKHHHHYHCDDIDDEAY